MRSPFKMKDRPRKVYNMLQLTPSTATFCNNFLDSINYFFHSSSEGNTNLSLKLAPSQKYRTKCSRRLPKLHSHTTRPSNPVLALLTVPSLVCFMFQKIALHTRISCVRDLTSVHVRTAILPPLHLPQRLIIAPVLRVRLGLNFVEFSKRFPENLIPVTTVKCV